MKIRHYPIGGEIVYSPVEIVPGAQKSASGRSTSGSTGDSSKVSDLTKSVIDQIKSANGIDSDVTSFINTVQRLLSFGADPMGQQLDANDVFKVQIYANKVRESAKYRDLAVQQLNNQDAWGEVALNAQGQMYVLGSDGKLTTISPVDYAKAKGSYEPITYASLLALREKSTKLAYDNDVLKDIQNAVGMSTIMDTISKIVKSFGTLSESTYATKEDRKVAEAFKELIGNGPDGVYKITKKGTYGVNSSEQNNAAIKYIKAVLPKDYRKALLATATVEGIDPDVLIAQAIIASANSEINPQYQAMASKEAAGGSKSKSGGKDGLTGSKTFTLAESYATGEGAGTTEWKDIAPEGSSVRLRVPTRSMSNAKQKDGKQPIGKVSVAYLMDNAYGISDVTLDGSVSFGDHPLTDVEKTAVMYDGATMRHVMLPYKVVNGRIVPDLGKIDELEQLTTLLREQEGSMTPGQLQDILNERMPGAKWDPITNTVVWTQNHAFLTFKGFASSEYMHIDKDSRYLAKVSKDRGSDLRDIYEEAVKFGSAQHEGKANEYIGHASTRGLFNNHANKDTFYEGNVFIALDDPTVASAVYNGQEIPKDSYTDITEKAEARKDRLQMRTNF